MSHPLALNIMRLDRRPQVFTVQEGEGCPPASVSVAYDTVDPVYWIGQCGVYETDPGHFTVWHHGIPGRPFKTDSFDLARMVALEWDGIDIEAAVT